MAKKPCSLQLNSSPPRSSWTSPSCAKRLAAATLIKINNPFVSIIALTAGDPNEDEIAMVIARAAAVINKGAVLHTLGPAITHAVKQVKTPV